MPTSKTVAPAAERNAISQNQGQGLIGATIVFSIYRIEVVRQIVLVCPRNKMNSGFIAKR